MASKIAAQGFPPQFISVSFWFFFYFEFMNSQNDVVNSNERKRRSRKKRPSLIAIITSPNEMEYLSSMQKKNEISLGNAAEKKYY